MPTRRDSHQLGRPRTVEGERGRGRGRAVYAGRERRLGIIPTMWNTPGFEALPAKALLVTRIRLGFILLLLLAALVFADSLIRRFVELPFPPLLLPSLVALTYLTLGWIWTRLAWRAVGWRLDEKTFETRSGVYRKVWKGIPRDRVQFVEVTSGPLQRRYELATLVVRTAGVYTPAVSVRDLMADVAEHLRAELSPEASDNVSNNAPGNASRDNAPGNASRDDAPGNDAPDNNAPDNEAPSNVSRDDAAEPQV